MNRVTQWMVRDSARPLRLEVVAGDQGFEVVIDQASQFDE